MFVSPSEISTRASSYPPVVRADSAAGEVSAQSVTPRGEFSVRSALQAGSIDIAPLRPVQFLGAKTRVLDGLSAATLEFLDPGARVLDAFTGSSLVSQQLARAGFLVTASDALNHCVHFARALLGVGRSPAALCDVSPPPLGEARWVEAWRPWLRRERSAIARSDAAALIRLSEATPQLWRPTNASSRLAKAFDAMRPGETCPGIVTAHYAGTYFGVAQAVELDQIRASIDNSLRRGLIGPWEESVLLTALLSAASDCAFSAGKHYAQPHRIRPGKDLSFIRSRIISDRSKDVGEIFRERLKRIALAAAAAGSGHTARRMTFEEYASNPYSMGKFRAIYADPPYTAQQYSRFYHVPEVICANRAPRLQRINGDITRGVYCEERFKSAFCSRRQAKGAFDDLIKLTRAHGATLFLSYSGSRSGQTGNARAVSVDDLRALLVRAFGSRNVLERELAGGYRQFNNRDSSVNGRDDYELLFVAKADA